MLPPLVDYSPEWQGQLADELESDTRPPCGPVEPHPGCSATKRAIIDYGDLRRAVRALGG